MTGNRLTGNQSEIQYEIVIFSSRDLTLTTFLLFTLTFLNLLGERELSGICFLDALLTSECHCQIIQSDCEFRTRDHALSSRKRKTMTAPIRTVPRA